MEPFSFPPSFYAFFGISVGLLLMVGLIAALLVLLQKRRSGADEAQAKLDRVRNMSGEEFERYLAWLFHQMGYQVQMTPRQGDFGADLILTDRSGRRTAVQAKCWNDKQMVGVPDLHEVFGGAAVYDCQDRLFVTTARYTAAARWMAQKTGTHLWDLDDIARAMAQVGTGRPPAAAVSRVEPLQRRPAPQPTRVPVPQLPPSGPSCPDCGSAMTKRSVAGQLVWVCSRFPHCRGARTEDRP